jgi:integrase
MPTMKYDKRVERILCKLDESKKLSEANRKTIKKFYRFLVMDNYSHARIDKYLNTLIKTAENIDFNFTKATKDDIENMVLWINTRKDVADITKSDYKKLLKRFYRWIGDGEYPKSIAWLNTSCKHKNGKLPEEMLTEEDVIKLVEAARYPRDRALIILLWETGARMGEIIDLCVGSFEDHKYGLKIVVDGKTGQRRIPLIDSVPYINAWLTTHPRRDDKNAPMWVNVGTRSNSNEMLYPTISKMLRVTAKRAKINKPVHPHHFRHSRATYLATRFTEAQLCQWFGWVMGSKVPGRYVHLSGRDIDIEYGRLHGIVEEDKPKESKLTPKNCPRCSFKVAPTLKFCGRCGMLLDPQMAADRELFGKVDGMASDEIANAMISGEKIDMRLLAKMVAEEIKGG